jgi:hypothetical protein
MSRLVLSLLLLCAVPMVSFAQERAAETRAASVGYHGLWGAEGGGLHGGFARLVFHASGRLAGVVQLYGAYDPKNFVARQGDETYRSSGGDTVVVASGGLRVQGHYGRLVPHAQVLIGAGAARTATTVAGTVPGTGTTTRQNRRMSGGFLTQVGVGLTMRMSNRVGVTTTLDALSPFPNPLRGVYGLATSLGVTTSF